MTQTLTGVVETSTVTRTATQVVVSTATVLADAPRSVVGRGDDGFPVVTWTICAVVLTVVLFGGVGFVMKMYYDLKGRVPQVSFTD